MSILKEQLERVKRFLNRIEDQDRDSTQYDDDLWSFFQNCYHLKDWIRNDPVVPNQVKRTVEEFVRRNDELRICADLANRSKHLKLDRPRDDAKITSRSVIVCVGGISTCEHAITLRDGSKRIALDVARKAVDAWESFLSKNGLI
jgi:hypothetical protein